MIPKILDIVWGRQTGYVCLSTKDRSNNSWEDNIFKWPHNRSDIGEFIQDNSEDLDVYWAPMVFKAPRRKTEDSTPCKYLWADLDPVNPNDCYVKPSIAWESSPGRYQAIWLLTDVIDPVDHDELNKRLTYAMGADKSGWDLTQVLRLPGTLNHKYVEKPPVKMMWAKKTEFSPQELADQLPPVGVSNLIDVDGLDIEFNDLRELVWPYRKILGDKLWELLFTPNSLVEEGDRSDRIWELEARLLEANIPVMEVVKIAKASPWNKYRGRNDENKRILAEVLKAEEKIRSSPIIRSVDLRVPWVSYSRLLGQSMAGPGWLIEGIWANNSHGMIAGEPKTYKSIISTEIAVSIASGYPMWDMYGVKRKGSVLIIQEENAPWVVRDRLMKVASSKGLLKGNVRITKNRFNHNIYVDFPPELPIRTLNNWGFNLTDTDHRVTIENEISRIRPVLVILDPLYLMLGDIDDNSAQELRDTLNWLLHIKAKYSTSIMILHHWNKGGQSGRGGQRMLGSTTLHAWVESALYTSARDTEKNDVTIEREFRAFMKPENLVMKVDMSAPGDDPYYKAEVMRNSDSRTRHSHADMLRFLRSNGECYVAELVEFMGITATGTKKILQGYARQGILSKTVQGGKGQGNGAKYTLTPRGEDYLIRLEESGESE